MIEILIDARNFNKLGAGFSIELTSNDHKWSRGVILGKVTTNQAELKAVEYALKSIKDEFLSEKIVISTSNKYSLYVLTKENGEWKEPQSNKELVNVVRQLADKFAGVVVKNDASLNLDVLKAKTQNMMLENKEFFEKI